MAPFRVHPRAAVRVHDQRVGGLARRQLEGPKAGSGLAQVSAGIRDDGLYGQNWRVARVRSLAAPGFSSQGLVSTDTTYAIFCFPWFLATVCVFGSLSHTNTFSPHRISRLLGVCKGRGGGGGGQQGFL